MLTALRRTLAVLVLPTAAVVVLAGPASAAPAPALPHPVAGATLTTTTTQGIIMRDGGVCDPIRHMGC